ncbi:hypothetical protein BY458DRAFT_510025 [Sporodiniella umbellata]|nr:hypothetical protein BY458DRAFT_510025 [Sporodiniella umbellata]
MSNKKEINISATTAVDLRAELAQQTELFKKTRASAGKQSAAKRPEAKRTIWSQQNKGLEARKERDRQLEEVEGDVLIRSREQLEKKAKIYEAMKSGQFTEYEEDEEKAPLVDFDKKYLQERQLDEIREETERKLKKRRQEEADDPWVEYVDEYGRTRTVRQSQVPVSVEQDEDYEDYEDGGMLRPEYEMGDGLATRADINHYDADREIRTKGVGFYRFSKDDDERDEQLAKLNKLRQETENARQSAVSASAKRQQMMAKNAEKIRARKAALQARKKHPLKHNISNSNIPEVNEESINFFLQSVRKQVE